MKQLTRFMWLALAGSLAACSLPDQARSNRPAPTVSVKPWAEVEAAGQKSETYDEARQIGTLTHPELREVSGIAPHPTRPGIWWVHNDSDEPERIYAINSGGQLLASFNVTGARNVDWEDLAGGTAEDGTPVLYLADTGDNGRRRSEYVVYRVRVPEVPAAAPTGSITPQATAPAEAFPFRYPDGPHDAEALLVDPATKAFYLITKTLREECAVYRYPPPLRRGERVTLERVRVAGISKIERLRFITGAAVSPDGSRLALLTYFSAFELRRASGSSFESFFAVPPMPIKVPTGQQIEAISYSPDGQSLIITGEKLPAPIYELKRR